MQVLIHRNQTVIHLIWWAIHNLKKFSLISRSLYTPLVNKDLRQNRWPHTRITRMAFAAAGAASGISNFTSNQTGTSLSGFASNRQFTSNTYWKKVSRDLKNP